AGGCSPIRYLRTSSDPRPAVTWDIVPRNGPETGPADGDAVRLTERQQDVLRAAIRAYVGEAAPIGSKHISHLLLRKLSSATIRATLAELSDLGLVQQPHTSAGRVPTEQGLRTFIDRLLDRRDVAEYDRRAIEYQVENAQSDAVVEVAAQVLSEQTRLLGFAVAPRLER